MPPPAPPACTSVSAPRRGPTGSSCAGRAAGRRRWRTFGPIGRSSSVSLAASAATDLPIGDLGVPFPKLLKDLIGWYQLAPICRFNAYGDLPLQFLKAQSTQLIATLAHK